MMKHARWLILGCLALCLLWSSWAGAQAPSTMAYQGRLLTAAGVPVNSTTSVVFSIYAAASGGSAIWVETRNVTTDLNGVFTIDLGSTTPLTTTIFDGTVRYLGIRIASESAEITPRQALSAVPYAMRAAAAPAAISDNSITTAMIQSGAVTTAQILDGTVANADLAANAVTTDKIADGTITAADIRTNMVSSVEGVANHGGNIDLVPGAGLTITGDDAANTVTITPAAGGLHPIAYGIIYPDATIANAGSGNWTVTWNVQFNAFEVVIREVDFNVFRHLAIAQGLGWEARAFLIDSLIIEGTNDHLLILPRLFDNTVSPFYCSFIVYDLPGMKMSGEAASLPPNVRQSTLAR